MIEGHTMVARLPLSSKPMLEVAQLEMLKQPLLVAGGNEALTLRIQL